MIKKPVSQLARLHMRQAKRKQGQENGNWKGGKLNHHGYVMIYNATHPYANKMGYVMEHRLIMEKNIDRYLKKNEIVHHINGIRNDNRIENLVVLSKKEHMRLPFKTFILIANLLKKKIIYFDKIKKEYKLCIQ